MVRTLKMVKHLVLPFDQKAQSWVSWRQLWKELQRHKQTHIQWIMHLKMMLQPRIIHSSPVCPGLEIGNVWTWFCSLQSLWRPSTFSFCGSSLQTQRHQLQEQRSESEQSKLGFLKSPASCSHWRVGGAPWSNQPLNHQSAAGMVLEAILPIDIYIKARYVIHSAGQWRSTSALEFVRDILGQFGGISFSYLLFICLFFLIQQRHYFQHYFIHYFWNLSTCWVAYLNLCLVI